MSLSQSTKSSSKKSPPKSTPKRNPYRGRQHDYAGCLIYKLVKENPRRKGTNRYKRFQKYQNGMPVEAALKVMSAAALRQDRIDGLIDYYEK